LDHARLREKSRIAWWDSPEARALLTRLNDNAVNWGLMLEAAPVWDVIDPGDSINPEDRRAWVKRVQALFGLWLNSIDLDAAAERTGYQLQGFTLLNKLRDGEVFAVCRYSPDAAFLNPLQLQFVNPDQVRDPIDGVMISAVKARGNRIIDGIEISAAGKEIAIYVWDDEAYSAGAIPSHTCTRIPKRGNKSARLFYLHPKLADSAGQVRGISALAHIIHELKKLTDYGLAELEAAVINAIFAAWIKPGPSAPASKALAGIAPRTKVEREDAEADGEAPTGIVNKPGIVVQTLKAGEVMESFDTKRPNVNFADFHDTVLSNISISLGMPLSIVKMAFAQNYSASRGEICFFWNTIDRLRYDFTAEFLNPVYELAMAEWVKAGKVEAAGFDDILLRRAWLNCEWTGIQKPSIDPQKEATAVDLRIAQGATTREREAKIYNGSEYDDNVAQLAKENAALAEAKKSLRPEPAPAPVAEPKEEE
jgi:lambda family phage portal protein